jgi:hypothetical protein
LAAAAGLDIGEMDYQAAAGERGPGHMAAAAILDAGQDKAA